MSLRKALVALIATSLVTVFGVTGAAHAAPALEVSLTHSPSTMPRTDRFLSYTVSVQNTATNSATVGDVLPCSPAAWFQSPTFTYKWLRDGVAVGAANGGESASYTVQAADSGRSLQCVVTGTNAGGASVSFSNPIVPAPAPVQAPPSWDFPTANPRPTVAGTAAAQRTCTAPATWTGSPTFSFQWLRNGQPIPGATSSTYLPQAGPGQPDELKVLQCQVTGTNAGGTVLAVSNTSLTTTNTTPFVTAFGIAPPNNNQAINRPAIDLGKSTSGPVTVVLQLPVGTRVASSGLGSGWSCTSQQPFDGHPATVTCTRSDALGPQASYSTFSVGAGLVGDVVEPAVALAIVSGGGSDEDQAEDEFFFSGPGSPFGIKEGTFFTSALNAAGSDETRAGAHPVSARAAFEFNGAISADGKVVPVEVARAIRTDVPHGFVGNPVATGECPSWAMMIDHWEAPQCPRDSIVGGIDVLLAGNAKYFDMPVYRLSGEGERPAQFGFALQFFGAVYVFDVGLRADDGYAVRVISASAPHSPAIASVDLTLCGFGTDVEHNTNLSTGHAQAQNSVGFVGCKDPEAPDASPVPFLTNPARCPVEQPVTRLSVDSWENPGVFRSAEALSPLVTDCDDVLFTPSVDIAPTSETRDSASGVDAEISVPTDGLLDPDGISQAHLKKAVVTLPEGVSVNPSGATGLKGCSDAQLKLGTNDPVECPDGSKIGTVDVETPLLEEHLTGDVVLRTPESTDPESGDMLRMAIVARSVERGVLVKLPGSATADAETGRLVATFDNNPQLPFSDLKVSFKGGSRGVVAMPQSCGQIETETVLTSWNELNQPVGEDTPLDVNGDCSFGFAPKLAAGMSEPTARATGDFSFRFSREDGEQWLDGLTATLPQGLLASVRDIPLCSSADAEAGACPAGSRIGTVDATAGSGTPFVLERKGDAYLTQGYKGCAYGLMVKVPVVAGPFDGSSPETDLGEIVVRQSVCVDRATAQVTATSDRFPRIWHGIPLRVRSVTVKVDRQGFMLNPSGCDPKKVGAQLHSVPGSTADASAPFQASGCSGLPYKPRIALEAIGRRQVTTGTHPRLKAIVRQDGVSEAGIERAVVRLPKSLALDPDNAQALCEFADGTKPDLESHCPAGSIVGRARAKTPLLKDDLVGNVYFVKNVRRDPVTGNEIRTLPMIVVALRGEIAINLRGQSSTTKGGKLVNTFANVPDAPISQFNLNIKGGQNGILAVTRTRKARINLCASRQTAEADTDGQNGRHHDFDIRIKTPCTKQQTARAKRAAAKARAGSKRR